MKILPQIICGDFNIDLPQRKRLIYDYVDSIRSNAFKIFNINPARVTKNTSTCTDHFITQNIDNQTNEVLQFQNFSDHYPLLLNPNVESNAKEKTQTCRDLYFLKDPKCIRNYLFCLSNKLILIKTHILINKSVQKLSKLFKDSFLEITNEFAPMKTIIASKPKNPKWQCNELKKLKNTKN